MSQISYARLFTLSLLLLLHSSIIKFYLVKNAAGLISKIIVG